MNIKYIFDGYGEVTQKDDVKLNLLTKDGITDNIGYLYILNIEGFNVCKIGTSLNVFKRISGIRQVVRCVFPHIENSIHYNVFISKPVSDRFKLEKKIHNLFSEKNIDGEWFDSSLKDTINVLKEEEINYVNEKIYTQVLDLFNPEIYGNYLWLKDFKNLKKLKAFSNLDFSDFIAKNYNHLFEDKYFIFLRTEVTLENIIELLKSYQMYINNNKETIKSKLNLNDKKIYTSLISANKKINIFIEKYDRSQEYVN